MFILILLLLIDVDSYVFAFTSSRNQIQNKRNSMLILPHKNLVLYTTTTKAAIKSKKIINIPIPFSFEKVIQNNNETITTSNQKIVLDRFERTASQIRHIDEPCIITIDNTQYNVTSWGTNEHEYILSYRYLHLHILKWSFFFSCICS
jgi:hypothetical protein